MWGIPKKTVEPNLQFVGAPARRLLPTLGQSPNNKIPSWFPALGQSPNMWRGLEPSGLRSAPSGARCVQSVIALPNA